MAERVTIGETVGIMSRLATGKTSNFDINHAINLIKLGYCLADSPVPIALQEAATPQDALRVIQDLYVTRKQAETETLERAIAAIFGSIPDSELKNLVKQIRCLTLDGENVTDDGRRCDQKGNPAENSDFSPLSNARVEPWGNVEYFHLSTGEKIPKDAFQALPGDKKRNYEPLRTMYFEHEDTTYNITQNSTPWIVNGVAKDIELHPQMVTRYAAETGTPYQGHPDGGLLHPYRRQIAEAAAGLSLEFSKGKILERSIGAGVLKSWYHVQIATLCTLHCEFRPIDFANASDADLDRYLDLIELFVNSTAIPESELQSYRDPDGDPLPGLGKDQALVKDVNAITVDKQQAALRYMAEELLLKLNEQFGNRSDVRTNATLKRLGRLYYEKIVKN